MTTMGPCFGHKGTCFEGLFILREAVDDMVNQLLRQFDMDGGNAAAPRRDLCLRQPRC